MTLFATDLAMPEVCLQMLQEIEMVLTDSLVYPEVLGSGCLEIIFVVEYYYEFCYICLCSGTFV